MDKEYGFCFNGTKEMFFQLLQNTNINDYIISTLGGKAKFGIERTGHSGGNWFIPEIVEYEDRIELVGTIQYICPKDNRDKHHSKVKDKVVDVLLHIITVPFVLIFYCIVKLVDCFKWLIRKISKKTKQIKPKTTEDKLYDLMINHLGCTKV